MRTNRSAAGSGPRTHEGGPAVPSNPLQELRRTIMACLLWESNFYESGETVADRIKRLVPLCQPTDVMALAVEARGPMRLRHAPLFLMRELARHPAKPWIADTLAQVIQRADELSEFLAMYWSDGRKPLSAQVKRGLAKAFRKFNAYELAKYNRDNAVKLRDVLFMVHPKPVDDAQEAVWKQLADRTLPAPDTWEVALSSGADKGETFTRLITEKKLGYMALLRNLRNMHEAGVDYELVGDALMHGAAKAKALPFRYIAAARAVPAWEALIDQCMQISLQDMPRLKGSTTVLVDVSGSMDQQLSAKSDLTRLDAACALAILIGGIAESYNVFTFSEQSRRVPPRRGMALADAIIHSQSHGGTYLGQAVRDVRHVTPEGGRLIVITDEQSADEVGGPGLGITGYMINVATNQNGVGFGDWTRISGFSEAVVQYIQALEAEKEGDDIAVEREVA